MSLRNFLSAAGAIINVPAFSTICFLTFYSF